MSWIFGKKRRVSRSKIQKDVKSKHSDTKVEISNVIVSSSHEQNQSMQPSTSSTSSTSSDQLAMKSLDGTGVVRPGDPDGPCLALVSPSCFSLVNLSDGTNRKIAILTEDEFLGIDTIDDVAYLATKKELLKVDMSGKMTRLRRLENWKLCSSAKAVSLRGKMYIIQPMEGRTICFDPVNNFIDNLGLPGCNLFPSFCIAASDGCIYALGGGLTRGSSTAKRFDPSSGTWSSIASMQTNRVGAAAACHKGRVYVMGGQEYLMSMDHLSSVECYDPGNDVWTEISHMTSVARYGFSACVINDQLSAIGGRPKRNSHGFLEDTIETYDEKLDKWTITQTFEYLGHSDCACILLPCHPVTAEGITG